jgi:pantoate--beta-alanine ligase
MSLIDTRHTPLLPGSRAAQVPVAQTRAELAAARGALVGPVAVVMTMGALHDGHAALIRSAAQYGRVIVTIFVNPLQFGAGEDLDRYPRTLGADLEVCAEAGADLVFAPTAEVMYPTGAPLVRVDPGPGGSLLEGASRPGHFDGVLTVVSKLLNLTRPDRSYFGEKDFQQLTLIRRMVADLDMPVEIVGVPIQRDRDGLALSSRNRYLGDDQHETALTLSRALAAGAAAAPLGRAAVLQAARDTLLAEPGLSLDRLDLVDPVTLADATSGEARLLVAAILAGKSGPIRLIDNTALTLGMA